MRSITTNDGQVIYYDDVIEHGGKIRAYVDGSGDPLACVCTSKHGCGAIKLPSEFRREPGTPTKRRAACKICENKHRREKARRKRERNNKNSRSVKRRVLPQYDGNGKIVGELWYCEKCGYPKPATCFTDSDRWCKQCRADYNANYAPPDIESRETDLLNTALEALKEVVKIRNRG